LSGSCGGVHGKHGDADESQPHRYSEPAAILALDPVRMRPWNEPDDRRDGVQERIEYGGVVARFGAPVEGVKHPLARVAQEEIRPFLHLDLDFAALEQRAYYNFMLVIRFDIDHENDACTLATFRGEPRFEFARQQASRRTQGG
jgi:hypothetical protein